MMRVPVVPAVLMACTSLNSSFSVLNSECFRIASRLAASSGLGTLTVKGEIHLTMVAKLGQFIPAIPVYTVKVKRVRTNSYPLLFCVHTSWNN